MKTAVSIPDDLLKRAEWFARQTKRSRSRVFCDALRDYLAQHSPHKITEAMNQACAEIGDTKDSLVSSAMHRILERTEW